MEPPAAMPADAKKGRDGSGFDAATIAIGVVGKPHGVRGEVSLRLYNVNVDEAALEGVDRLVFDRAGRRQAHALRAVRPGPHGPLVTLEGIDTREQAAALTLSEVLVERDQLPELDEGEYYVADVIGCEVFSQAGARLGTVAETFWNGAQDVMIVRSDGAPPAERLIPLVPAFVREVDAAGRKVLVDWDEAND
jgi:16S rRNA processing protein RimM